MTAEELRDAWEARDGKYVTAKSGLDDDAIHAVREYRKREASEIDNDDARANALNEAALWLPPVRLR